MGRRLEFGVGNVRYLVCLVLLFACQKESAMFQTSAKHWYPQQASELQKILRENLQGKNKIAAEIRGLIVPHAGYVYSGKTAGNAFAQLSGKKFKRVIVLGPSHQYPLRDALALLSVNYYQTPLGQLLLDREVIDALRTSSRVIMGREYFASEHSVDNQIPFLQQVLGDFKLVPILLGQCSLRTISELANLLRPFMDKETLLVISSDFTHYGKGFGYRPFTKDIKENLRKLDMAAKDLIELGSAEDFYQWQRETGATICGAGPITLGMELLGPAKMLEYTTSGELTGDFDHSVSYLAFVFTGRKKMELDDKDKKDLLNLARQSIEQYLKDKKGPHGVDTEISDNLKVKAGAFVTLTSNGQLRGCIGEILPRRELHHVVAERAVDAAVNDMRFPALSAEELSEIRIEISVLTPPLQVASWQEIEIGRHGMILYKNGRSAVFLPQVAPEQKWDLATTLTHLSLKAGLAPDDWKKNARFEVFEALVFHE